MRWKEPACTKIDFSPYHSCFPSVPYSPSVTASRASSLSEGAFLTNTFYAYLLSAFFSSAQPLWNPATMAGFSRYKKREPSVLMQGSLIFIIYTFKSNQTRNIRSPYEGIGQYSLAVNVSIASTYLRSSAITGSTL